MDPNKVQASLRQIAKIYSKILDDESRSIVIPSAIAGVKASREKYDLDKRNASRGIVPTSWGYTIAHNQPLRFIRSEARDLDLHVDIYCIIQWKDEDIPIRQDIKVRIWSEHENTIFRTGIDALEIRDQLNDFGRKHPGRVVSRFHFDRVSRDSNTAEGTTFDFAPEYHIQIGGVPESYELCWHPKKVNIPRLMHQPMELFLTCQMIAANFYWREYEEIRKRREWKQELIQYQKLLLIPHYRKCIDLLDKNEPLLDNLQMN